MPISNTPRQIAQKVILLTTGSPGSEAFRAELLNMYETRGNWTEVAAVVDTYMNALLAESGNSVASLVRTMANNALGMELSMTEAQQLTEELKASGIDSWSKLFTFVITKTDGNPVKVLDNRATSANRFTDLLASRDKDADYDGSQALAAANEWVRGIGLRDASREAADASASDLIARFMDGNVQGTVMDGYVAGATVFIDVDGDGQLDADEPSTQTDANGNYMFEGDLPAGVIMATGGTDLATGLAVTGTLSAANGGVVITPLTTLMQQMLAADPDLSVAAVEALLFAAFDLPLVDLSTYDPIQSGLETGASRADQVLAVQVQALTAQIVNVLNVSTAMLNNLQPGNPANAQAGMTALVALLSASAAAGTTIDLADTATLAALFVEAAAAAGSVLNEVLGEQIAQSLEGINALTQQAVAAFEADAGASIVDALSDIFRLQIVTQARLVPALEANTSGDLSTIIAEFHGASLVDNASEVLTGRLDANTAISEGSVTDPDGTSTPPPPPPPPPPLVPVPVISLAADTGSSASDGITSNGTVNVSALQSGATWEYSLDSGSTWTAGSASSFTVTGSGQQTLLVRQTDTGNVSQAASLTFTLDTSVPAPAATLASDTGTSSSDGITSNGTVNVSGLESGAAWEYNVNGAATWTPGSGSSFTLSGDGEKQVLVRQTDVAGNVSTSGALTFTLEDGSTPAPVLTLASDTGGSASDGITSNGTINVAGLAVGASWEYSVDGAGTWTSGAGSSFAVSGDGAKTILVRQTTPAGSTSENGSLTMTLDTAATAPVATLATDTGTAGDGLTSNGLVTVSGLESGASWEYNVNGAATWTSGTGSDFTVSGDGAKAILVRQTDAAGNVSAASTALNFTLDATLPATPAPALAVDTGASASDGLTSNGLVNVGGIESGAAWEYSLNAGTSWTAGSGSSLTLTGTGARNLLVRQTDDAGNVSATATLNVTLYVEALTLGTLNGSNGLRLDGGQAGDAAGTGVAGIGDFNGDGYDDVMVSAPYANPDGDGHLGSSYVVFGKASGFTATLALAGLDGSNGFRIDSENVNGGAGVSALGAAGDVNGDGYADLIIGSRYADPNGSASGSSYVVFGSAAGPGPVLSLASLDGSNGFRLDGGAESDNSGWAANGAGDINGDGFDDVIVGAFAADPNGVTTAGASYVIFGKSAGFAAALDFSTLAAADGFRLDGTLESDSSGVAVSGAGDINGDGIDDLVIGARRTDFGGESSGSAYVVFGKTTSFGTALALGDLDGSNGFRLDGITSGDFVGYAVSAAGDVNGDGYADLIVGAFGAGESHVVFGSEAGFAPVIAVNELDGTNGFRIGGSTPGDNAGMAVSGAGDVNGDGIDDLLIGARFGTAAGAAAGATYVVFGKTTGFDADLNLAALDSATGFRLDGVAAGDEVGASVSAAGDVNGDGFADFLVGAPFADPGAAANAGSAYLIFGADFSGTATSNMAAAAFSDEQQMLVMIADQAPVAELFGV